MRKCDTSSEGDGTETAEQAPTAVNDVKPLSVQRLPLNRRKLGTQC